MEISIRSVGDSSGVSRKAFAPGDRVWSYLYRTPEGYLDRVDILEPERDELALDGPIICKWSHVIKEREATEAALRRVALQSADEVFLSLFDEGQEAGDPTPEREASRQRLKFFLALQLERKRILKPLGARTYRHVPTGREIRIPELEITPELISEFRQELSMMGGA